jgi:hypothetical protein
MSDTLVLNITEELVFQQYDIRFHSTKYQSQEVLSYEDHLNVEYISFNIKEFTSDEEDYFGVNISKYALIAQTRYVSFVLEGIDERRTFLGEFCRVEHAIRFAQFVISEYAEHKFAACPITDWDHYLLDY